MPLNPLVASSLQYVILPGKPTVTFPDFRLYDKAFRFWQSFWRKTLAELGATTINLPADDFLRHEIIAVLTVKDQIIGQHAYCFFDLERAATQQHSFIVKYFQGEPFLRLKQLKLRQVMSLEFLAVLPEWRSAQIGLSLGAVIIALACQVALSAGLDGMIGAARSDVPVARFCYESGAEALAQGLFVHGRTTDLIYWTRETIRCPEDKSKQDLVRHLWCSRIDTTGITHHAID